MSSRGVDLKGMGAEGRGAGREGELEERETGGKLERSNMCGELEGRGELEGF